MTKEYILILGATSEIAMAVAHEFARRGYNLYLAARHPEKLAGDVTDLEVRYEIGVRSLLFDALDYPSHDNFYKSLSPPPAGVICAVGHLGDQKRGERDFSEAEKIIGTNFTGCVSILNIVANDFEERSMGFIIGISSAAGDRGRKTNYLYGSSKAGLTAYLSGLRNRLQKSGVRVMTVKPGFVNTRMTAQMDLPQALTAEPGNVAGDIFKAHQKNRDVLYTRWFWRFIMLVIIHIPEKIFKRLSL